MTNKHLRSAGRAAAFLLAAAALTMFATGLFGGPTAPAAHAQGAEPSCDLAPFSAEGDDRPTCVSGDPAPIEIQDCQESDFFLDLPYVITLTFQDAPTQHCYNLTAVSCPLGEVNRVEVIGVIVNPPPNPTVGSAGTADLVRRESITAYGVHEAVLFSGSTNVTPGSTVEVILYGQSAGLFSESQLPVSCPPDTSAPTFTVMARCDGFRVDVAGDFNIDTSENVQVDVRFSPVGGGDPLDYGTFNADSFGGGSWLVTEFFRDVPVGDYGVTIQATGTNADTGNSFDETFGPAPFTREDCVDVVIDCAQAELVAKPLLPLDPNDEIGIRVFHEQREGSATASLVNPETTIDLFVTNLFPPGTYSYSVSPPESPVWETGTVYCLEFFPRFSCTNGQTQLYADPGEITEAGLAQLDELAIIDITLAGQKPEDGLPAYTFLFDGPPASLLPLEISLTPQQGQDLTNVDAQVNYVTDINVDIPTCETTLTYECDNGQAIVDWTRDGLPGAIDDGGDSTTQVRKTSPLPVASAGTDGQDAAGTLLTFTVGQNADQPGNPQAPTDNGVFFTDTNTRTTQRNKLDCDVDVEIYCRNGRAVIDISEFEGPTDNDGEPLSRPVAFDGFTVNGESGFQPGIHAIDNALEDITISEPSLRVQLIPGDTLDATIASTTLPADTDPVDQIDGPDCAVLVTTFCRTGETILRIDPGDTGLTQARLVFDESGTAFQNVTWSVGDGGLDTTPQEIEVFSDTRVLLTQPGDVVHDLRIEPADEITTVNHAIEDDQVDLTDADVPLVCTIPVVPACSDGLSIMTGTVEGSRADELVVTNTETNGPITPDDEDVYDLPNGVTISVTTLPDPATTDILIGLQGGSTEPTVTFALDCIVIVRVACVDGQAVLHANAGTTGARGLQVGTESQDFPNVAGQEPELDFIVTNTAVDATVEVTILYHDDDYEGADVDGLSINDPREPELGWEWLESEVGTIYEVAEFDIPLCTVSVRTACGSGDGGLTGMGDIRFSRTGLPRTPVYAQDTALNIAGNTVGPFQNIERSPYNLEPGATFIVSANNGVWIGEPGQAAATGELTVPYCTIIIQVTNQCIFGGPRVQVTVSPGGVTSLENVRDESVFVGEFTETFRADNRNEPIEITLTPDEDDVVILESVNGGALESSNGEFSVDAYVCGLDGRVVCGLGEAAGAAILDVSLIGTPPGTEITSDDVANEFGPLPAGESVTFTASNGVWFTVNEGPSFTQREVPFCQIDIVIVVRCIEGQPIADVTTSPGEYQVVATGGSVFGDDDGGNDDFGPFAPDDGGNSASETIWFSFDPPGLGMTVIVDNLQPDDAIVVDADGNLVDHAQGVPVAPVKCVVDPTIECAAGAAFLIVDLTNTPAETVVTPSNGEEVAQGQSITVQANNDVYLRHTPTDSLDPSIELSSPVCQVSAELVCQTGEGGPTGMAVLRATISPLTPAGTVVIPGAGTTVASEGLLTVSVNNQVHFSSSNAATAELTAPACLVTATAVARCVSPGIDIEVTLSGASASNVIVNGDSYPVAPGDTTTVITGLAALNAYEISLIAAEPETVAVGAVETISITERCTIELDGIVQCVSGESVLVTLSPTDTTTGTIQSISVNGDVNLPFLVAPGAPVNIQVSSTDTLQSDIVVPALATPTSCDNSLIPLAGTLYVTYETACDAAGQNVVVSLVTDGSAGVIALSVNGDPAAPFVIDQGVSIVVSVLTFIANDVVVIDGPEVAPVCIAPTGPEQTPPSAPIAPLPPAIVVVADLGPAPAPDAPDDPTPEPPVESTPDDPTPEEPPESSPEPAPDTTPEEAPEPTEEPAPDPPADEVLSARTTLRQHGPSSVFLPAVCDVDSIELPGAVTLMRAGAAQDGLIEFTAETAQLDVGTYKETVSCGGQTIEIVLFVYSQIGGARGEANSISRLAVTAGVLTLVLIGVPGILARKDEEVDEI